MLGDGCAGGGPADSCACGGGAVNSVSPACDGWCIWLSDVSAVMTVTHGNKQCGDGGTASRW